MRPAAVARSWLVGALSASMKVRMSRRSTVAIIGGELAGGIGVDRVVEGVDRQARDAVAWRL